MAIGVGKTPGSPGLYVDGPIARGPACIVDLTSNTAAYTVTTDQNGSTFLLGGTGVAITLPSCTATAGLWYKFIVSAAFSTDYVLTATPTDTFEGCVIEAGAVQTIDAADTITLEDGVENIGDFLEFFSDGTSWITFGNTLTAASVTPAG